MKKLVLIAAAAVLALTSCGSKKSSSTGVDGSWLRISGNFAGTVVEIKNGKGKISHISDYADSYWNVGDYKFKNIKKEDDTTYSLGDLYTSNNYVDCKLLLRITL